MTVELNAGSKPGYFVSLRVAWKTTAGMLQSYPMAHNEKETFRLERCPGCAALVRPGQSFCPSCGAQMRGNEIQVHGTSADEVERVATALYQKVTENEKAQKETARAMPDASQTVTRNNTPGFLDAIIIILVSSATVIFLLWATSRTLNINAFESLPAWLEKAYNAIWASVVAGTAGIGLAIVNVFTRKPEHPRPNYLLLIGITTVGMIALIFFMPRLFAQRSDNDHQDVEAHLVSGGFPPTVPGAQLPGTQCGQTAMVFSDSDVTAKVDEFKEVRWDASYLCRRQGLAGPASGKIEWGTPYGEYSRLPGAAPAYGLWGTMRFKYFRPGRYTVNVDVNASCIDVNMPPNPCTARGQFDVTVSR